MTAQTDTQKKEAAEKAAQDKAAKDKAAADKAAAEKAAADDKSDISKSDAPKTNIPDTTGATFGDDVQKMALVSGNEQPIDKKKTQEQIDIDHAQSGDPADPQAVDPLTASGYVFVDDPTTRQHYIAQAEDGVVTKDGSPVVGCILTPLANRRPEAGLTVFPEGGDPFNIPTGVDDWMAVRIPQKDGKPGDPLIAPVTEEKKSKGA